MGRGRWGEGGIFACGKFKFELFMNGLCYAPETLSLSLTFTRDYFAEKKKKMQILHFQGVTYSLTAGIVKT